VAGGVTIRVRNKEEERGAAKGEKCALCGNPMNEGAVVCGSCGAERKLASKGCLPIIGVFLMLVSIMPASCIAAPGQGRWVLALGGIAGLVVGFRLAFGGAREVVYQRQSQ